MVASEFEMTTIACEVNPDLFVGLPFSLPATEEAAEWVHELDFIDPAVGDLNELRDLARRAPSPEARSWVESAISVRDYQELFSMPGREQVA